MMLAKDLYEARKRNRTIHSSKFPQNYKGLYKISKELISLYNNSIICWKLGSSTVRSRNEIGNDRLIFGPIINSSVFFGEKLSIAAERAEAEICFRIRDDFKPYNNFKKLSDIFSSFSLALDFPYSCIEHTKNTFPIFIADLCGAGNVLIGQGYHISNFSEKLTLSIETENSYDSANFRDLFLYNSEQVFIEELLLAFKQSPFSLLGGQYILCGGITKCINLKKSDSLRSCLNSLQELEVKII